MKNLISILILTVMTGVVVGELQPSSTSSVSLIGGVIKARRVADQDSKYPRKDCPVCEGKGWYISGDGIEKVDCGYCEETKEEPTEHQVDEPELVPVIAPPKEFILR
jgi:hypothetical protein